MNSRQGAHFGLRRRKRAGAQLLELLPPVRRKISIQIKSLLILLHSQHEPVPPLHRPLGQDPVVGSAGLDRIAPDHQSRLLRVVLPQSVRVRNAHLQDPAVAVDVLDGEPLDLVVVPRVRTGAGAHPLRLVGERPFGAVGVDPRANVERTGVQGARHVGILAVLRDERLHEIERGGGRRDFGRMDVAVDPERRLLRRRTGRGVGDGQHPDVASLVALADRLDRHEVRIFGGEGVEDRREVGVAVEAVEGDAGHCAAFLRRCGGRPGSRVDPASYRRSAATPGGGTLGDPSADSVEYRIFIRLIPLLRAPDAGSETALHAPRLRRTALPVELHFSARRVAPGGAGRARPRAGLRGARRHRRVLALGHRPRASCGEGRRPPARRRQRGHARRRNQARAARPRPRELRQSVAIDHARTAQRR